MSLPPHNPAAGHPGQAPVRPPIQWTMMPPPEVQFTMWVDGSLKINFAAHKVDDVIACIENHLASFRAMKEMVNNPPKKCTACRGAGQIMVKQPDGSKAADVCSKCHGSGQIGLIPPNVQPVQTAPKVSIPKIVIPNGVPPEQAAMMVPPPGAYIDGVKVETPEVAFEDDPPPKVELPHQKLEALDLDPTVLGQMQKLLSKHGYKVTALSKDEQAEALTALTESAAPIEPPKAPEPPSPVTLSIEELQALARKPTK